MACRSLEYEAGVKCLKKKCWPVNSSFFSNFETLMGFCEFHPLFLDLLLYLGSIIWYNFVEVYHNQIRQHIRIDIRAWG